MPFFVFSRILISEISNKNKLIISGSVWISLIQVILKLLKKFRREIDHTEPLSKNGYKQHQTLLMRLKDRKVRLCNYCFIMQLVSFSPEL